MVSRSVRQDLPPHDKQSVLIAYVSQRWKKNKDEGSKINHQNTATDLCYQSIIQENINTHAQRLRKLPVTEHHRILVTGGSKLNPSLGYRKNYF